MSKIYTLAVSASFVFDVHAESEEEAKAEAKRLLSKFDAVEDDGAIAGVYRSPWVSVAGHDTGFPSLEVTDIYSYPNNS